MTALLRPFEGMLPMQLGTSGEVSVFLLSCLVGALLGLLYQALRALRVIFPHFKAAVFLEDMLFGLFCGFCYFLMFSYFSLTMRGFIAFGMALSAFLAHISVGNALIRLVSAADRLIKKKLLLPLAGVIAKIFAKFKGKFVQEYKKYNFFNKSCENRLKEPVN